MDRPAGQVLREFMRGFVRDHIQTSLFEEPIQAQQDMLIDEPRDRQ
jgi:hypothetical protein